MPGGLLIIAWMIMYTIRITLCFPHDLTIHAHINKTVKKIVITWLLYESSPVVSHRWPSIFFLLSSGR
jgi:hypothetical protein